MSTLTPTRMSSAAAKRGGLWDKYVGEIAGCHTVEGLRAWADKRRSNLGFLPLAWLDELREVWAERAKEIRAGEALDRNGGRPEMQPLDPADVQDLDEWIDEAP